MECCGQQQTYLLIGRGAVGGEDILMQSPAASFSFAHEGESSPVRRRQAQVLSK